MKKVLLMIICSMLLICSCGSKVPDGFSERGYEIGKNALKVVADYNTGNLTKDEAIEKVDEYVDRLSKLTDQSDQYHKDLSISVQLDAFRLALVNGGDTFAIEDKIKEILGQ